MRKAKVNKPKLADIILALAKVFALIGIIFLVIAYAPSVWYQIKPEKLDISKLLADIVTNPNKSKFSEVAEEIENKSVYQPRRNPNLTKEKTLMAIFSIVGQLLHIIRVEDMFGDIESEQIPALDLASAVNQGWRAFRRKRVEGAPW